MPVTCWLHALGTVFKGFCSVLGLFRVAQLHAGYMSCVQITTANNRKNDLKRLQIIVSLVLSEGDTESVSPSEAACGMAQENIFFKISNKFILSIFLCINSV